ncbi:MAG: DUF1292 domain-containing protein [Myxococcota bacterium]
MADQTTLDPSADVSEDDLLELEDEDGNILQLFLLAMVDVEEKPYAMAVPQAQLAKQGADEGGDIDLYLFAYSEDDEGAIYEDIEDPETYDKVRQACEALLEM